MKTVFMALFVGAAVLPVVLSSVLAGQAPDIDKFSGAWAQGDPEAGIDRLIIRRNELIIIEGKKITHGIVTQGAGGGFRYIIDFVNSEPSGIVEKIRFARSGEKLTFSREDGKQYELFRFHSTLGEKKVERKGFGFKVPEGWVSNVELATRMTGKKPENYDMDQLVHFYEAGLEWPTEDMTIRLLDKPIEAVKSDMEKKQSNLALTSRKSKLLIGVRKGYVFENSAILGKRRVVAKVYIIPLNSAQTVVLAVPTLLRVFPFDLDRDCLALLMSVEQRF